MSRADDSDGGGALLAKLRARIHRSGPIPIDAYMLACLAPILSTATGARPTPSAPTGDFITAPEISQVFGELIGLWCVTVWQSLGQPPLLRLIELGPGRGTLLRDALRAARAVPAFLDAVRVHLIEVSEPLRQLQRRVLPPPSWGRVGGGGDPRRFWNPPTPIPSPQGGGEPAAGNLACIPRRSARGAGDRHRQ